MIENEASLRKDYENRKPALKRFGDLVLKTICDELNKELSRDNMRLSDFLKVASEPRIKETDSFLKKAFTKKYIKPLEDITDQVGIRFVVLLQEDITKISNVIKSVANWKASEDRNYEEEMLERPDYFSYQSNHYVIRPTEKIETDGIIITKDMACEVQVRTLLQHAYAEMSHDTDYKPSIKLPKLEQQKIKRLLARGSALLETTDDTFKNIKEYLNKCDQHVTALLNEAKIIYTSKVGVCPDKPGDLTAVFINTYREKLSSIEIPELKDYFETKGWLGKIISKKREESVLYKDPVIILLYMLIEKNQADMRPVWPVDLDYLKELYGDTGKSTEILGF